MNSQGYQGQNQQGGSSTHQQGYGHHSSGPSGSSTNQDGYQHHSNQDGSWTNQQGHKHQGNSESWNGGQNEYYGAASGIQPQGSPYDQQRPQGPSDNDNTHNHGHHQHHHAQHHGHHQHHFENENPQSGQFPHYNQNGQELPHYHHDHHNKPGSPRPDQGSDEGQNSHHGYQPGRIAFFFVKSHTHSCNATKEENIS